LNWQISLHLVMISTQILISQFSQPFETSIEFNNHCKRTYW
jgi:hypothetical protein